MSMCVFPFVTELALLLSAAVASLLKLQIFSVLSTNRGGAAAASERSMWGGGCLGSEHKQGKQPLPLSEGVGNFCFSSLGWRGHVVLPHASYFLFWAGS